MATDEAAAIVELMLSKLERSGFSRRTWTLQNQLGRMKNRAVHAHTVCVHERAVERCCTDLFYDDWFYDDWFYDGPVL
ncbi:uncharacterized protein V6R79_004596 [Siganus canaliculatus]